MHVFISLLFFEDIYGQFALVLVVATQLDQSVADIDRVKRLAGLQIQECEDVYSAEETITGHFDIRQHELPPFYDDQVDVHLPGGVHHKGICNG